MPRDERNPGHASVSKYECFWLYMIESRRQRGLSYLNIIVTIKQGRIRPLDKPKRMIDRRER